MSQTIVDFDVKYINVDGVFSAKQMNDKAFEIMADILSKISLSLSPCSCGKKTLFLLEPNNSGSVKITPQYCCSAFQSHASKILS